MKDTYPISTLTGETQKEFIAFVEAREIAAKIEVLDGLKKKNLKNY